MGSDEYDCLVLVRRRSDQATANLSQTVRLYDDGRFVFVGIVGEQRFIRMGLNGNYVLHEMMAAAFAPDELADTGT